MKDVPTEPLAPRSLSAEAIDALLRAARAEQNAILRARDEVLLALLISTGLRVQEACDLQLRDLDLGGGTITIWSGKPGKARRVPLHPDAARRGPALCTWASRSVSCGREHAASRRVR